jgi:hypothetical protein
MNYTKSRTQTPREYTFPAIDPITPSIMQSIKPQTWCKTVSPGPNDVTLQTTNGDFLVLCSFEINSSGQQIFNRLQISNIQTI